MADPQKAIGTALCTSSADKLPSGDIVLQLKDSAGNVVPIKITSFSSTVRVGKSKQLYVCKSKSPNILKKVPKSSAQYIVRKNDALSQTVVMPSTCAGPTTVMPEEIKLHQRPVALLLCPSPAVKHDDPCDSLSKPSLTAVTELPSSHDTTLEAGSSSQLLSSITKPPSDTDVADPQAVDISLFLPEFMRTKDGIDQVIEIPAAPSNSALDYINEKSQTVDHSEATSSPSVEVQKDVYIPTASLINLMALEDDDPMSLDDGEMHLTDDDISLEPEEKIMSDGIFCVDGDLAPNPDSINSDCLATTSSALSAPSLDTSVHTASVQHRVLDYGTPSQRTHSEPPTFSDVDVPGLPTLPKLENRGGLPGEPPQDECYVYVESQTGKLVYVNSRGEAFMDVSGATNKEEMSDMLEPDPQPLLTDLPMPESLGFPEEVGAETVVVTTVPDQNVLSDQDPPVSSKSSIVVVLPTEPCLSSSPLGAESESLNWSDVWLSEPQETPCSINSVSSSLSPLSDATVTAMATHSLANSSRFVQTSQKSRELTIREIHKRERDRLIKREMRKNDDFRLKERNQAKERMQNKRADPTYRQIERIRDKLRRRQARLRNKTQRMQESETDQMDKLQSRPGEGLDLESAHYYSLSQDVV